MSKKILIVLAGVMLSGCAAQIESVALKNDTVAVHYKDEWGIDPTIENMTVEAQKRCGTQHPELLSEQCVWEDVFDCYSWSFIFDCHSDGRKGGEGA